MPKCTNQQLMGAGWGLAQGYQSLSKMSGHPEDGERGLTIFRNEPIDLVVLDYKMPRMLGDEVAREMRRVRRSVPLLLVTAFHDLPTTCTSVFDGVILKGDSPEVLLARIKELLEDDI